MAAFLRLHLTSTSAPKALLDQKLCCGACLEQEELELSVHSWTLVGVEEGSGDVVGRNAFAVDAHHLFEGADAEIKLELLLIS